MEIPTLKNWKVALLLSIIMAVSVFTAFRISGIVREPSTVESTVLNPVIWETLRPSKYVRFDNRLNSTYSSVECSMVFSMIVGEYDEDDPAYDADWLGIKIQATSNSNVSIKSIYVSFHKDCQPSLVDLILTYLTFDNLSLQSMSPNGWTGEGGYKEAYISLVGSDQTIGFNFEATAQWSLLTPNNQTHQMDMSFEITYSDGTFCKKVTQPFDLKIVGKAI